MKCTKFVKTLLSILGGMASIVTILAFLAPNPSPPPAPVVQVVIVAPLR